MSRDDFPSPLPSPSQMEVDSEVQETTTAQMEKKFKQNKINSDLEK